MKDKAYAFSPILCERIIEKLRRTDSFEHVPDILVNSDYDVENDEVYAFEELIGNHGGAGGNQQYPFILYPSDWELDEEIFGAENVNKFFMRGDGKVMEQKIVNIKIDKKRLSDFTITEIC